MTILKNTQFLKLWGNQILLQTAFNMSNFTALLLIDQLTHSKTALAQFYVAITLPAFIVGILAGSIVDMTNRKKLMLITDFALVIMFLLYAFFNQNFWALLLIAFFSSAIAQFFTPAEMATIPVIVKGKQLEHANALFLFTGLGSVLAGYALAGPVIDLFGRFHHNEVQAAFMLASFLTLIGFFLRLTLNTIETVKPHAINSQFFRTTIRLVKEVFYETKKDPRIFLPIILLALMEFNIGMLAILFLEYVRKYLFLPSTSASYFLILPLIIGLGLGIYIMNKLQGVINRGGMIFLGSLLFGMTLIVLGVLANTLFYHPLSSLPLRIATIIGSVIIGSSAVLVAVHSRTILQENTPEHMMGRVFSLVTLSASAITPIPILLVALITEKVDVTVVFICLGISLCLIAFLLKPIISKKLN